MTILQSADGFTDVVPRGIWLSESPNEYAYEFLICNDEYAIA